jgi:hypothetical protein
MPRYLDVQIGTFTGWVKNCLFFVNICSNFFFIIYSYGRLKYAFLRNKESERQHRLERYQIVALGKRAIRPVPALKVREMCIDVYTFIFICIHIYIYICVNACIHIHM